MSSDPEIEQLRELHTVMDRAVLDAYGWDDIPTDCEFLLDYDDDEEDSRRREEAVALPLARRGSRRGARAADRAERRAGGRGAALGGSRWRQACCGEAQDGPRGTRAARPRCEALF